MFIYICKMNDTIRKHVLPHVLAFVGFLIISVLVFLPSYKDGKGISQPDILLSSGCGHQMIEIRKAGDQEDPLWNSYMFGGMPGYVFAGVVYPEYLLARLNWFMSMRFMKPILPHKSNLIFIPMVSFYILLLSFGVMPWVAFAGAVAFGLNGFNIISIMAGHNAKVVAVAYLPLVLAGIHLTFKGRLWLGFMLTVLSLALHIRSGHLQITYYLLIIVVGYGVHQLLVARQEKAYSPFVVRLAWLVLAVVLSVGLNFGKLGAMLEYSPYSIRGESELREARASSSGLNKEYAFTYSNGILEPFFLFVPNIYGGSSQQELSTESAVAKALMSRGANRFQVEQQVKSMPTYWGKQPLTAPYYAGTLTVVFFILGIFIVPRNQKAWLVALVVLGIVLSWGKNFGFFNELMFDYLPGYNKFRSVTFAIIITIFSMNLLGFMALDRLVRAEWNRDIRRKGMLAYGIAGGFLLLLLMFSGVFPYRGAVDAQLSPDLPDWFVGALREDRRALLTKDAMRALFFIIVSGVFLLLMKRRKVRPFMAMFVLLLMITIDSFVLSRRFINKDTFKDIPLLGDSVYKKTEADEVMLASIKPGERVLNLQNPFNECRTSYYYESIGGYHGAKIRRYQDLIDHCIGGELQRVIDSLRNNSVDFGGLEALNMLNTRFFYAGEQRANVFSNQYANGNAWIVEEIIPVASPDEEIARVCHIDTKRQAIVDSTKFAIPASGGIGDIRLVGKSPNRVTYLARVVGGTACGIFSEVYYPKGWKAYIDGEESDIYRANYLLRALEIPEGEHQIVFEFKPRSHLDRNLIVTISTILVMSIFVAGVFLKVGIKRGIGLHANRVAKEAGE